MESDLIFLASLESEPKDVVVRERTFTGINKHKAVRRRLPFGDIVDLEGNGPSFARRHWSNMQLQMPRANLANLGF